jgi:phage head maturation protease
MNEKIVNLPKFGMSAEVRSASFDEGDNTIEVIWTTGAAVRRWSWRSERYYQEILEVTPKAVRLDRLNSGAPLLDTHDDWSLRSVIGSVVPGSARIEGGKGYARVKLSRADEDKAIVEKIRDGIIRNISVGYAIHKVVKTDADGDGNDEEWRVVDWEPLEISAVPVPADAGSQIRKEAPVMVPCEFVSETATGRNEARRIRMAMRQRQSAA